MGCAQPLGNPEALSNAQKRAAIEQMYGEYRSDFPGIHEISEQGR
jgi:hypothetical protein